MGGGGGETPTFGAIQVSLFAVRNGMSDDFGALVDPTALKMYFQ